MSLILRKRTIFVVDGRNQPSKITSEKPSYQGLSLGIALEVSSPVRSPLTRRQI